MGHNAVMAGHHHILIFLIGGDLVTGLGFNDGGGTGGRRGTLLLVDDRRKHGQPRTGGVVELAGEDGNMFLLKTEVTRAGW